MKPTRILLVEDNEDDALLLSTALNRSLPQLEMHRVENAAQMRSALAESWDLVISDHSMPQFDCFGALGMLREAGVDIPFIIYSGALDSSRGYNAIRSGAEDFIDKGHIERLVPVIERALKHGETRRAQREAEQARLRLENFDALTQLPNQHQFEIAVRDHLSSNVAVLYVDVDRFMRINDSFGYATGDQLMRRIAERLDRIREGDELLARIGRDEFAFMVPSSKPIEDAQLAAERISEALAESFTVNGQALFITASIGIACSPRDGSDPAQLLKNAESAMFSAKRLGRNTVLFYRDELNRDTGHRLRLESALRHAVELDQFSLAFQPIIEVDGMRICGTEALIRWHHPELGWIPPDQFISIADESSQIHRIGEWVLRRACEQTHRWHLAGHTGLTVAVNFSAAQFKHHDLHEHLRRIVDETGLRPDRLEIEITETLAMQDAEASIATLKRLKDMGCKISIDDFGTGYSSLSYLRRLPIDILKIDRAFVRDAEHDGEGAAIVRTIVALARSLKLIALAEGVETASQAEFLKQEGCDRLQGYYFSKPCDARTLETLLEKAGAEHNRDIASSPLPALA